MNKLETGRLARVGLLALVTASSLGAGCTKKPSAIVVAISSEAKLPNGVEELELKVDRGASTPFFRDYVVTDGEANLPGTITLQMDPTEEASSPITITVTARVAATKTLANGTQAPDDVRHHVLRRVTMGFVDQTTKLLRLPLRFSCVDFPTVADGENPDACGPGRTCRGGACVSDAIDVATLPDFDVSLVDTVAGPSSACFDDTLTEGCFAGAVDVTDPTALAQIVGADGSCTLEIGTAGAGPGADAGGPADTGGDAGTPPPPVPPGGSGLNIALNWRVPTPSSTAFTTLDFDPVEGWAFDGTSRTRAKLSTGICDALKAQKIGGIRYATKCDPKTLERPVCEKVGAGSTGFGGNGGTITGAGGASTSGDGGATGTGGSGMVGSAGGAGIVKPSLADSHCVQCLEANTCLTAYAPAKNDPAVVCALACPWMGQICQSELDCAGSCATAQPSPLAVALLDCIKSSLSGNACASSCLVETGGCPPSGTGGAGGGQAQDVTTPPPWVPRGTYVDGRAR